MTSIYLRGDAQWIARKELKDTFRQFQDLLGYHNVSTFKLNLSEMCSGTISQRARKEISKANIYIFYVQRFISPACIIELKYATQQGIPCIIIASKDKAEDHKKVLRINEWHANSKYLVLYWYDKTDTIEQIVNRTKLLLNKIETLIIIT